MKYGDFRSCLFLFNDDSSLISAVKTSRLVVGYNVIPTFGLVKKAHQSSLSERQVQLVLGRDMDFHLSIAAFLNPNFISQFDFVYSVKYVKQAQDLLRKQDWSKFHRRPVFISAFPGLELLPEMGLKSRSLADVLCFNSRADVELATSTVIEGEKAVVRFNSMLYSELPAPPAAPGRVRDLLFIPQNALPLKRAGREHVAEVIADIARTHADCRITVKLRQEHGENRFHTHREYISYPKLLSGLLPEGRVSYDSDSMETAARKADAVLTCTSTGAAEAMALGVPAMFYTAYPGAEDEPQYEGTKRLFEGSGLLVTREQAVALQVPAATQDWWDDNISGPKDLDLLVDAMLGAYRRISTSVAA